MSGTQIIAATIHDELARSRRRGWALVFAIGLAFGIAWAMPRFDQSAWTLPPAILAAALLGGAVGAAHRQRMFGRQRVSQFTAALLTMTTAATLLTLVVLVNRLVGSMPGASPLEQALLWMVEEGYPPLAPAALMGILFLLWIPFVIHSQREVTAEAAAWRETHGPDGFTPIA
jgi:hypothetical protein